MMRIHRNICLIGLAILFSFAGSVSTILAQGNTPVSMTREQMISKGRSHEKLRLAQSLIRQGDYMGASAVLETMYVDNLSDKVIYSQLKTCYEQLKFYGKWEELARRFINNPAIRAQEKQLYKFDLAKTLVMQDRPDEAMDQYRNVASVANDEKACRTLIECMLDVGFYDETLSLIDSLRKQGLGSNNLTLQRGQILRQMQLYNNAALEYLTLFNDTTAIGNLAERKMLELLRFEESSLSAEKAMLEFADSAVSARAIRLLSSHYLETERIEEAFAFSVRHDSLDGGKGKALVKFMRTCVEHCFHEQTVRMGQYILDNNQDYQLGGVFHLLGEALAELERYDEAIAVYDTIFSISPRSQEKAEALYNIGAIYLDRLKSYDMALVYFDSVVNYYRSGHGHLLAVLAIPYCYLRSGRLDQADQHFKKLSVLKLNTDIVEEIDYHLGLIRFCQKEYDSAKVALKKHIVNYPDGFYVNDALEVLRMMERAENAPDLLYDYSNTIFFELRRMPDSTEAKWHNLVNADNKALADIALFRLSQMTLARADTTVSINFTNRLIDEFPGSYYVPYSLKIKADIQIISPETIDEAKSLYRQLLEQYPNYPFASEIRKRMRDQEIDIEQS